MKKTVAVTGMTCAACSARVEKVTKAVAGVNSAEVNLLAGKMTVEVEDESVLAAVSKAVSDAGYGMVLPGEKKEEKTVEPNKALTEMKKRIVWSFGFLAVLMYFTMGHMVGIPAPHWNSSAANIRP